MCGLLVLAAFSFAGAAGQDTVPGPVPAAKTAVKIASTGTPEAGDPARVVLPSIGVDTSLERLNLNSDRTLQVPEDFQKAGWWAGGARPGTPGPAVIVGHVDSHTGPAVFYRLSRLAVGDPVLVKTAGGRVFEFRIERVARYPKNGFPTDAVYGATAEPTLRLITCGGRFDQQSRSYEDNVVAFATLVTPGV
jgi:hypothetical protein